MTKNRDKGHSRRKVLKTMAATSGVIVGSHFLPSQWMKPVIDQIVLPAHAQTSSAMEYYGEQPDVSPEVVSGTVRPGGGTAGQGNFQIHIIVSGSSALIRFTPGDIVHRATAPLSGGSVPVEYDPQCGEDFPTEQEGPQTLQIVNYDASQMTVAVTGGTVDGGPRTWQVSVPAGTGSINCVFV